MSTTNYCKSYSSFNAHLRSSLSHTKGDKLSNTAGKMAIEQKVRAEATLDYEPSRKLVVGKMTFAPQYAQLYFCRLCTLRESANAAGRRRWGPGGSSLKYANRIVDIRADVGDAETVVAGVVFRMMGSKPSILHEYNTATQVMIPPPPSRRTKPYSSAEDKVVIEDENGRCVLDVDTLPRSRAFTTGVVLVVRGRECATRGVFVVSDFITLGAAPQRQLALLAADRYVAFLSAPELGDPAGGSALAVELLLEYLRGNVGDGDDAAAIVQLVVTGNLLAHSKDPSDPVACIREETLPEGAPESTGSVSPMVELDRFLTAASSVMPVAVLPGETDPVNHLMPQQPLHRCLLPSASRSNNLYRAPNPLAYLVDDRLVMGSSGQPVSDFALYGELPDVATDDSDTVMTDGNSGKKQAVEALDVLETMLESRHLAPTCPDTLASYPFSMEDPFIIEKSPHIFFAGNQHVFSTRMYSKSTVQNGSVKTENKSEAVKIEDANESNEIQCRLLGLPRFCDTGRIVLVNLRSLHCSVHEFALTL